MLLADTNDKLQLVTTSAATVDVHVSYADLSSGTVTPGKQNTAISSATTTDILAAPAGSTVRQCKTINIRNKDASLAVDVTVVFDDNGTDYELHKVTLDPGECLVWKDYLGSWFLIEQTAKLNKMVFVTADSSHVQGGGWGNITGLQAAVVSGRTYVVLAHLYHQTNATTTGAQFGIGGVAMTEMIATGIQGMTHSLTAAAFGTSAPITAVDTAINVEVSINAATTNYLAVLSGYFKPSASGTFSVRAQSEQVASATLTVKKGSWAMIRETDN